jgi:hypothetical protein
MSKFIKKKLIVDAEQWFPGLQIDGVLQPSPHSMTQFAAHVITSEGAIALKPGDWIVTKNPKERYVYANKIFQEQYQPVDFDALQALEVTRGANVKEKASG